MLVKLDWLVKERMTISASAAIPKTMTMMVITLRRRLDRIAARTHTNRIARAEVMKTPFGFEIWKVLAQEVMVELCVTVPSTSSVGYSASSGRKPAAKPAVNACENTNPRFTPNPRAG